jgi:hypothetical protein
MKRFYENAAVFNYLLQTSINDLLYITNILGYIQYTCI